MPNTALQGYPYPALSDAANGPTAFQSLGEALENTTVYVKASTAMPPHKEGRVVYVTDTDRFVISDGTNWIDWGARLQMTTWDKKPAQIEGLVVYDTDLDQIEVSDGTRWLTIPQMKLLGSKATGTLANAGQEFVQWDHNIGRTPHMALINLYDGSWAGQISWRVQELSETRLIVNLFNNGPSSASAVVTAAVIFSL